MTEAVNTFKKELETIPEPNLDILNNIIDEVVEHTEDNTKEKLKAEHFVEGLVDNEDDRDTGLLENNNIDNGNQPEIDNEASENTDTPETNDESDDIAYATQHQILEIG